MVRKFHLFRNARNLFLFASWVFSGLTPLSAAAQTCSADVLIEDEFGYVDRQTFQDIRSIQGSALLIARLRERYRDEVIYDTIYTTLEGWVITLCTQRTNQGFYVPGVDEGAARRAGVSSYMDLLRRIVSSPEPPRWGEVKQLMDQQSIALRSANLISYQARVRNEVIPSEAAACICRERGSAPPFQWP